MLTRENKKLARWKVSDAHAICELRETLENRSFREKIPISTVASYGNKIRNLRNKTDCYRCEYYTAKIPASKVY